MEAMAIENLFKIVLRFESEFAGMQALGGSVGAKG
jgi:hypothetical protein